MNDLIGETYTIQITVGETDTALIIGSGTASVFATPRMAALMEQAAYKLVENALQDGYDTVGTKLSIEHMAATPIGMGVKVVATLVETNGRELKYEVAAWDDVEQIGSGIHNRFIVKKIGRAHV